MFVHKFSQPRFWSWLAEVGVRRSHGLIVKGTAFESLPLQTVTVLTPMAPETEVVSFSGGLKTNTSTVRLCDVRSRDCHYQAVAADETGDPEGTIPTDH